MGNCRRWPLPLCRPKNQTSASPTKIISKAYKENNQLVFFFSASCSSIHLNAFMWPRMRSMSVLSCAFFFSLLNLCDKPKLKPKTKLFVYANMIKWKPRSVSYRHPIYTTDAFCFTSSLVDRLMTKLCLVKTFANTTTTRDASITVRFFSVFSSFRFLFFFFRFTKDNQNWWTGNAVFIEVYAIRAQRTTNLTTTKKEKKHLFLYALKMKEKKSKSEWFVAHTNILAGWDLNGWALYT